MDQITMKEIFSGSLSQVITTLIVTSSAISDGMQYGWTAPVMPFLISPASHIKISEEDETWLESAYLMAGFVGLPLTIYIVDKIGRHKTIILSSTMSLIGWILIGIATNATYLYIARLLTGAASDVAFVATPMYIAEIADQKVRGFLSAMIYIMMLIGVFLIYAVAPYVPFYAPSIIAGVILITQLILCSFIPESPYFLMEKKRFLEAKRSLNKLRSVQHDTDIEFEEIKLAVEKTKRDSAKIRDLFKDSSNRKAFIIVTILVAGQHFCGISVILMNLHTILQEAGSIYLNSDLTAILFSLTMIIAAVISAVFIDKYGRKILFITSSYLTGINLLILAIYFNLKSCDYDLESISWIPLACILSYGLMFKFGLGLIPVVLSSELFSNKVKAIGLSFADFMYILFAFISIEFYLRVAKIFGIAVPFYVFAFACFAEAVFCKWYVPETRGKSLDEIQSLLQTQIIEH